MTGWLSWLVLGLGVAAAAFLLARRERWWWLYVVPPVVVVSAVAAWLIGTIGGEKLFAAPLTTSDIVWIAVALSAAALAVGNMVRTRWWRKLVAVVAAMLVVAAAGNQINKNYQEYPAVRDLFGPTTDQAAGTLTRSPGLPDTASTSPLATTWTPSGAGLPADGKGKVVPFTVQASASAFAARTGWAYLPPAYFADNKEPLPVLVLIAGQPGGPDDWITGNRLQGVMDDFAAQHDGIAPVVVVPDALGSALANPLCLDSSLGNVDTYLAKDLPRAIVDQLNVTTDSRKWAVGGFSYGGTCSLQLATNHPDVYPTFIDVSGQREPTLDEGPNGRTTTVDGAFGGDESKFVAVNPADLLKTRQFPDSAGWFIWGENDTEAKTALQDLAGLAQGAGMTVRTWEAPGTAHDWGTAVLGLSQIMPWLATRTGLTP